MHRSTRHGLVLILSILITASTVQAQPLRERVRSAWARITHRSVASATVGSPAVVPAADTPQACQARLLQLADSKGWTHEMKGNVLYLAVPENGKDSYLKACGKNVIEFWKSPRHGPNSYHHLYTRFGDTNWSRISGVTGSSWYVPSDGIGVLSALEPSVAERTRQFLQDNSRNPLGASNRYGTIGSFKVAGGGGGPTGNSHCTNYWECAKVGDNGENMPKLHNMWGTGIAPGWISGLMRSNSPRVFAVAVYGNPTTDFSDASLRKFFE